MTKHRLRDEINADIDRFVDLKTEIMKVIDAVPDEVDRCVFERHFLKGKNYTVIGMEMKYNKDYAYKIIIKGSEKIQILENVLCSFMSIIINRSAGKENLLLDFGFERRTCEGLQARPAEDEEVYFVLPCLWQRIAALR